MDSAEIFVRVPPPAQSWQLPDLGRLVAETLRQHPRARRHTWAPPPDPNYWSLPRALNLVGRATRVHSSAAMPSILNVANMCSHLQNVSKARLGITSIKNTKYNLRLALAMHRAGFFSAVYRAGKSPPTMEQMVSEPPEALTTATVAQARIWLGMKYWDGRPVLSKAEMVSTPSRIMTATIVELGKLARGRPTKVSGGVVRGLNMGECMFLGTSSGVLEVREALNRKVGGILMCRVL